MMRPIGCWREKKVCYEMFCVSVTNILIPNKKKVGKKKMLFVSDNKAGDLFVF